MNAKILFLLITVLASSNALAGTDYWTSIDGTDINVDYGLPFLESYEWTSVDGTDIDMNDSLMTIPTGRWNSTDGTEYDLNTGIYFNEAIPVISFTPSPGGGSGSSQGNIPSLDDFNISVDTNKITNDANQFFNTVGNAILQKTKWNIDPITVGFWVTGIFTFLAFVFLSRG